MQKTSLTEQDMVDIVTARLRTTGIPHATEVPFLSRSVDLVMSVNDTLVAVEFKKSDWRRALEQAKECTLGAELTYICILPNRNIATIRSAAADIGIGVLMFDPARPLSYDTVLEAKRVAPVLSRCRQWLQFGFQFRNGEPDLVTTI